MRQPFFSIVLPSYNRAHILRETIASVLNQSFTNWELLIVDDGSKDNTKEIVTGLKDDRIRYIYQTNQERSVARNNGIKNVLGQYICFLDSDDLYKSNHLENLYNEIKQLDFSEALFFVNHTTLIDKNQASTTTLKYDKTSDYFIKNSIIPVRVCIHRSIFKFFQFDPRIVIVEDAVLWTQIALKYPIYHIEKETVIYRWHDENSVNIKNNCFLPRLNGLKILFESKQIKGKISTKKRNEAISNCYYGIARHYEYKKRFFLMLKYLLFSYYYQPKNPYNKAKIFMIYKLIVRK
ncbi:MAG: glycosyltransferase family 2 protein [Bacteroidota bacterium]